MNNIDDVGVLFEKLKCYTIQDYTALEQYTQLISQYLDYSNIDQTYCEKHHILPVSMFKSYKKDKNNLVLLPYSSHIEAHRLLLLMYDNCEMRRAYSFVSRNNMTNTIKLQTAGAYCDSRNPAKRIEVREKIRQSKLGVKRNDMLNKKYFGADTAKIEIIQKKVLAAIQGTVIVVDKNSNRFRVSIDDARYKSGELIPFNKGVARPNSASKDETVVKRIMSTRENRYNKLKDYTSDEFVTFLLGAHAAGKCVLKNGVLSSNYVMMLNKTTHNRMEIESLFKNMLHYTREPITKEIQ